MSRYLILLLFANGLLGQVTFEAKAHRSSVAQNERLRIDFAVNQDGEDFCPPNLDGFKVLSGPTQSVKVDYSKGNQTYSKTYTYFVCARREGEVAVGESAIEFDGTTYKTKPFVLTVTEPVAHPKHDSLPNFRKRSQKRADKNCDYVNNEN